LADKADILSGLFWLIFSVFVSCESYKLGLGTLHQPGPGFLFFWTGLVVGILSVTIIIRSFKKESPDHAERTSLGKWNVKKIIQVLASLFLYTLFMESAGYLPVTLLLFLFLLGVVEKKGWRFAALVSVIVSVASYLLFEVALQSQLPRGLLSFLRF
jgi:putative tricarboxylic transport membrane protein